MSYMPRAGWAGGMLSASKLYQSVSASGPSATTNPMATNTSSRASRVWVTRCRCPRPSEESTWLATTSVRSRRSSARRAARSTAASSLLRSSSAPSIRCWTSWSTAPASRRSSGGSPPRPCLAAFSAERLPSSACSTAVSCSVDEAPAICARALASSSAWSRVPAVLMSRAPPRWWVRWTRQAS